MYFKRIDTTVLYQPFYNKCVLLVANCAARSVHYHAISGLRTHAEQDALYAQGRTAPGPIVTKAKGGQSFHNFGVAIDFALDTKPWVVGLQPSWKPDDYKILAEEATKLGLDAGLLWTSFKDPPHIQIPATKFGVKLADLQKEFAAGGLPSVYKLLDNYQW